MSKIEVIVTGAAGRMGSIISRLVKEDADMSLVALVEKEEKIKEIGVEADLCGTSIEEACEAFPSAVIIDFTYPQVTQKNVETAMAHGNPMVIGTTGLTEEQMDLLKRAAMRNLIFWAPNMSVGINVLFKILPMLVDMLGEDYDIEICEIHHKFKKDAPSGTAVKLAQVLLEAKGWGEDALTYARKGMIGERPRKEIGVQTLRGGDVVGDHNIYLLGPGERLEITHRAHSRETFARGAIRATKWLVNRSAGTLYTMTHMLSNQEI